jgi:hypothetical protein
MKFPSRQKWSAFWRNHLRRKIDRTFEKNDPDRLALLKGLTEAAEVALFGQIADLLDDDDYEDPQGTGCQIDEQRRQARKALSRQVNYPRSRVDEAAAQLFADRPVEQIKEVKRDIACFLGRDSLRIRRSKFRDFVRVMNQDESAWGRYGLMLQGHGVSPDDDSDVAEFFADNNIDLGRGLYGSELAYSQASTLTEQLIDEWT